MSYQGAGLRSDMKIQGILTDTRSIPREKIMAPLVAALYSRILAEHSRCISIRPGISLWILIFIKRVRHHFLRARITINGPRNTWHNRLWFHHLKKLAFTCKYRLSNMCSRSEDAVQGLCIRYHNKSIEVVYTNAFYLRNFYVYTTISFDERISRRISSLILQCGWWTR